MSLMVMACVASTLVACGGKTISDGASGAAPNGNDPSGSGNQPGVGGKGADYVDAGPASGWKGPSGPTQPGFFVDGIACTGVTVQIDTKGAPCGKTWMLGVTATCGALGAVTLDALSQDDIPYPQACNDTREITCDVVGSGGTSVSLSINGDGGGDQWSSNTAPGGCAVNGGPSPNAESTPFSMSGLATNGVGQSHTWSYDATPGPAQGM
jgi:hypothetical protein